MNEKLAKLDVAWDIVGKAMQFLKKNWKTLLTIAGLALSGLGVYATYDVYNKAKPRKELQIRIEASLPVVDVNPEASKDIKILYKDQPVEHVTLHEMKLENTGNQPIMQVDFVRPVTFSASEACEIADISITNQIPQDIGLGINKTASGGAELTPVLLNPGDRVTIRLAILVNDPQVDQCGVKVDGRIVGIRNVELTPLPAERPNPTVFIALIAGASGIFGTTGLFLYARANEKKVHVLEKEIERLSSIKNDKNAPKKK